MEVRKGTIYANCSACGYYGGLNMMHKLSTFIVKNPPKYVPLWRACKE